MWAPPHRLFEPFFGFWFLGARVFWAGFGFLFGAVKSL